MWVFLRDTETTIGGRTRNWSQGIVSEEGIWVATGQEWEGGSLLSALSCVLNFFLIICKY